MSQKEKPRGFNYIYFGIYFFLLVLMSASSIFGKDPLTESRFFFFLYAIGQAALETSLLVFIGYLLQHFGQRPLFFAFIGFSFFCLILHILDFLLDRILDLSVWGAIQSFVLDETFSNFLYLLDASGVPIWGWGLIFGTLVTLPYLGILLYRASATFTQNHRLRLRFEYFPICFVCLPTALLLWDFLGSRAIHPNTYTAFLQSLPWKTTFLQPKTVVLNIVKPIQTPLAEELIRDTVALETAKLKKKPNIYLFVIESFRSDFITEKNSPHLFAFQQEAAPIELTLSNANASHQSWFSIFHSQFSHHWNLLQQRNWSMGSPPLHLLKNLGYQIHLYTSAQLNYYGMEKLLFGTDRFLLDSVQQFHHKAPTSAADTDAQAITKLKLDIAQNPDLQEGQVFLIFWDSTHFDYSWPKNWTPPFTPFASELAYFKTFYSANKIHQIKNRYRNAVHYIDHLFGEFLQNLPNRDEAIIVVTGDHGEEFFEHGHLFHGSHLVQEQTQVPILMQFGKDKPHVEKTMVSQIDIFPTILDFLTKQTHPFLEGQSIFRKASWPYCLISRFNAGRTPYEFCLHNGTYKLIGRFANHGNIFASPSIQITALKTKTDELVPHDQRDLPQWIEKEFGKGIAHLFHSDSSSDSSSPAMGPKPTLR